MRFILHSIALPTNVHKNLLPFVRLAISLVAVLHIGYTLVFLRGTELVSWKSSLDFTGPKMIILALVFVLMMANWSIEALKWKMLSSKVEIVSWGKIFYSVFYGISLGMITPKRSGEFAGRIHILKPENRISGLFLHSASSLSQLLVTLLSGSTALLFLIPVLTNHNDTRQFLSIQPHWLLVISVTSATGMLVFLYILPWLTTLTKAKTSLAARLLKPFAVFKKMPQREISFLLLLSLARYLVFSFQFHLLLIVFGLKLPFMLSFSLIALVYLLLTLVPLSAIWELGVRGSVALFVFGLYASHSPGYEVAVVASTTMLWVINLGIPALTGGLAGIREEVVTKSQNESDEYL